MHFVEPSCRCAAPAAQSVQVPVPADEAYVPAVQFRHSLDDAGAYFPASHVVQFLCSAALLLPSGHSLHELESGIANVPALHAMHSACAAALCSRPDGHFVQDVEPLTFTKRPAAHAVHAVALPKE